VNKHRSTAVSQARCTLLALIALIPLRGIASAPNLASEAPAAVDVRGFSAAIGPNGELWAVWSADNGHDTDVFYSRRTTDGWLSARPVYENPATWDDFPSLVFASDGTPWVAWSSADQEQGSLYVSQWDGSHWSAPGGVPTAGAVRPRQPALAAASNGELWLAWIGFDGTDDEIYASHWDGTAWSAAERVNKDDTDPLAYDTHPRLAVDATGYPWLVWVHSEGLFDDVVMASRWTGTNWLPEQAVSAVDDTPDVWPSLALDDGGQPWVAWQDVIDSGAEARWRIYVAHWQDDAAAWSAETVVSSPGGLPLDETSPSLTFDGEGRPLVAWTVSGELSGTAYASWDGKAWTQPAWIEAQGGADTPLVVPAGPPWLLRVDLASSSSVPLAGYRLENTQPALPYNSIRSEATPQANAIANRYAAFGDSITLGAYDDPEGSGQPVGPYSDRLELKLDTRVTPSEVLNRGVSGETTARLQHRIVDESITFLPEFPLIMEGTNDVSHGRAPNEVAENLALMLDGLRRYSGIEGIRPWLSTVIPRMDNLNDETATLNEYIRETAAQKRAPLADNWQAFYNYGDWDGMLMRDTLHPSQLGMQVLADTWYSAVLAQYSWLYEETTPPTVWIEAAQGTCGQVTVSWNGTDDLSWVVSYDVQVQTNYGTWTDWLLTTQDTSNIYSGGAYGDVVGFRVRGRDVVGNQSDYSAPVYAQVGDVTPPYAVQVNPLPPVQRAPFEVKWQGADACSQVAAFEVQYLVGSSSVWQTWFSATSSTGAILDPASPQYGEVYQFRVRARDQAGNWSDWSAPVSTLLARFALEGQVVTIRHEPVAQAQVVVPNALAVETGPLGRYSAYLLEGGMYDLAASRDGFAIRPPMQGVSVTTDMSGLDFVLPPLDDVVSDGGFEQGSWGDWQPGGTLAPTLIAQGHTGEGAALLGGLGVTATLSQSLSVPGTLTDATLSFLARLDDDAAGSSALQVTLDGTPLAWTQGVTAGGWTHVWFPVDAAVGQAVTLTFTISDSPAVRLDEVSLGSAAKGGYWVYLPLTARAAAP
jgi:lysophospholipase L1-like esterase